MNKLFILVATLLTLTCYSQKKANPQIYAKTITVSDLQKHLYKIASKEMEGRETATEGQRRAATYIESQFKELGLLPGNKDSYQQFFNVYQDSLLDAKLQVNGIVYPLDSAFNPSVSNNISGTLRFSEVTYVPYDTTAIKNADLSGRLLIMFPPSQMNRLVSSAINNLLRTKGAAAVLQINNMYPRRTAANTKGGQGLHAFKKTLDPQLYTISESIAKSILGADYDAAKQGTLAPKPYSSEILLETRKATTVLQSSNVIGVLPGTDLKDEYLFITGHYDHLGKKDTVIYYGADDDGSGTTAVMQMAKAFTEAKKAGHAPRRTIVFMTVSGEEKGLWGSEYYSDHPIFPLEKTTADLNIDMIGRTDYSRKIGDSLNYIYVVGDDKLSSELKPISEGQNSKYTKLELDYKFNDPSDPNRIYFRSDHYNFARKGVPIIFYYDGMLGADYHKPTDTPDKINYPLMAKRAQLVFYTAWEMANRDQMLKRDLALPSGRR